MILGFLAANANTNAVQNRVAKVTSSNPATGIASSGQRQAPRQRGAVPTIASSGRLARAKTLAI